MISIFWRNELCWQVEGTTIFGPNVVSFTITAGQKQWYVFGAYAPPNNQLKVHRVEQALAHVPAGLETLLIGDLND